MRSPVLELGALLVLTLVAGAPVAARPGDAELERILSEGTVVAQEPIGTGVTRPLRLTLEHDGRRVRAAFKYVDDRRRGVTRLEDGSQERGFVDSYLYERAAYLLDRFLGLGMVPVTVVRRVDDREGAVIAWVEDALSEKRRMERDLRPQDPLRLIRQQALMELFDALIANTDRNLENRLVTPDDWRVHLIDHSRAFRLDRDLPEGFVASPSRVTPAVLSGLERLDARRARELLDGLLTRFEIRALVARRDRILAKTRADRERYGDALVLIPPPREVAPAAEEAAAADR